MVSEFLDDFPPPFFNGKTDDFSKWERKYQLWDQITDVTETKRGSLVVLNLDGETQDTILEMISLEDLRQQHGADKVVKKLKELFKEDEAITAFKFFEDLNQFKRPLGMSITIFCCEFLKRLLRVKNSGTSICESVAALKLLRSANIFPEDERLIYATLTDLNVNTMMSQLKKVMGCDVPQTDG